MSKNKKAKARRVRCPGRVRFLDGEVRQCKKRDQHTGPCEFKRVPAEKGHDGASAEGR